jgi:uncharacterized protein YdhG (YjbR/CyaY superfamily)
MEGSDADAKVRAYVDAIAPGHRPLFDRLATVVSGTYPDATLTMSYNMPTYRRGRRRLHIGAWQHGLSLYGWQQGREVPFTSRHPEARTSKGTIRLTSEDAAAVSDDDLAELVRAALED